jgi:hypothetical protein
MVPFRKRTDILYGVKWRVQHADCAIKYRGTNHTFYAPTETIECNQLQIRESNP